MQTPDAATPPGPVTASERIVTLDVVRGLAVLGILAMNIVEFGLPLRAYDNPAYAGGSGGADRIAWYLQVALFDGRMRALFSMLFGAGLVLLGDRLRARGEPSPADVLLRRCLWLIPFGIAHRFLLQWTGDILYVYGLLGVLAVAFRGLRASTLVFLGVLVLAGHLPGVVRTWASAAELRSQAAQARVVELLGDEPSSELQQARQRWEARVASIPPPREAVQREVDNMHGSWTDVVRARWEHNHGFQHAFVYYYFVWDVLGMMLLGMGLLRSGFLAGRAHALVYWLAMLAGAGAAAASLWWAREFAHSGFSPGAIELRLLHDSVQPFARGLVGLGYAAALALLVRGGHLRWLTAALANVGRLAFSNYLLQTALCTTLFFGWGFGLYGSLSRARLLLVMVGLSIVQLIGSALWLRAFAFGPFEWLWRCLTYGRLFALTRRRA